MPECPHFNCHPPYVQGLLRPGTPDAWALLRGSTPNPADSALLGGLGLSGSGGSLAMLATTDPANGASAAASAAPWGMGMGSGSHSGSGLLLRGGGSGNGSGSGSGMLIGRTTPPPPLAVAPAAALMGELDVAAAGAELGPATGAETGSGVRALESTSVRPPLSAAAPSGGAVRVLSGGALHILSEAAGEGLPSRVDNEAGGRELPASGQQAGAAPAIAPTPGPSSTLVRPVAAPAGSRLPMQLLEQAALAAQQQQRHLSPALPVQPLVVLEQGGPLVSEQAAAAVAAAE